MPFHLPPISRRRFLASPHHGPRPDLTFPLGTLNWTGGGFAGPGAPWAVGRAARSILTRELKHAQGWRGMAPAVSPADGTPRLPITCGLRAGPRPVRRNPTPRGRLDRARAR